MWERSPPRRPAFGTRVPRFRYMSGSSQIPRKRHVAQTIRPRRHRQHAADQAAARLGGDRLHHPRQGGVHESGWFGEGSRRAFHHRGRDGPRGAEARRHRGGGDGGQHRHRAGAGSQRARLSHGDRHSRDAEPGEEGHAAPAGRGADRGAGGALQESQQLREALRPPRRTSCGRTAPRRGLGQPIRQHRQPRRPCGDDRPGNLGADRRQGGRLHLRGRYRRHARRRRRRAEGEESGHQNRPDRPAWISALRLGRKRRAEERRLVDHRGHRAGQGDGEPGGRADRPRLPRLRRGGAADRIRSRRARGGCCWAARRASTSRVPCTSPGRSGRGIRS